MRKYEHELKVPYYLLFAPDQQELTLYRHTGQRYASVPPDENGRCAVEGVDIEVGLLDGWVRFWHHGELLPLPGDLLRDLEATQRELKAATRRADSETRRADSETRRADGETRRADAEKQARLALERELAEMRERQKKTPE